jgi:TrmH family RNA methyltransferase
LFAEEAASALAPVLAMAAAAGAEVLSLDDALLAALCQTTTPQGVVAVAPWPELPPGQEGWSLIVDGVQDPGNLGTLLRSAAAVGLDQVILLPGVTDPWAPKVLRAGMGAHFRVAIRMARALAQVEAWIGPAQRLLAAAAAPTLYTEVDWTQPSALVIGSEAEGPRLTASWTGLRAIAIPMARGMESLNAAVAGSVILFEAQRQRRAHFPS